MRLHKAKKTLEHPYKITYRILAHVCCVVSVYVLCGFVLRRLSILFVLESLHPGQRTCPLFHCPTLFLRPTKAVQQLNYLLLIYLFLVHSLHMTSDMHLLFSPVHAVWTLKLRLFAALPFLVVPQATLQFVDPPTGRTAKAIRT